MTATFKTRYVLPGPVLPCNVSFSKSFAWIRRCSSDSDPYCDLILNPPCVTQAYIHTSGEKETKSTPPRPYDTNQNKTVAQSNVLPFFYNLHFLFDNSKE